jgi:hypothetical protein
MNLYRIVMRLARNPGTEFANGDDHRGYALTAPVDADGGLDPDGYGHARSQCVVRRFAPGEDPAAGTLERRGERWFFHFDDAADLADEPVWRLGDHRFAVGEYVTVTDENGRPLTYRITQVDPVGPS